MDCLIFNSLADFNTAQGEIWDAIKDTLPSFMTAYSTAEQRATDDKYYLHKPSDEILTLASISVSYVVEEKTNTW